MLPNNNGQDNGTSYDVHHGFKYRQNRMVSSASHHFSEKGTKHKYRRKRRKIRMTRNSFSVKYRLTNNVKRIRILRFSLILRSLCDWENNNIVYEIIEILQIMPCIWMAPSHRAGNNSRIFPLNNIFVNPTMQSRSRTTLEALL